MSPLPYRRRDADGTVWIAWYPQLCDNTNKFAVRDKNGTQQIFDGLDKTLQKRILDSRLTIYVCEGDEPEIKEWFKTINIAGVPLNEQELLNAMAKKKGESNCPLCAVGHSANRSRIYNFNEMDADHVTAWSKGGETSAKNCQMLCKTHNRVKGNR